MCQANSIVYKHKDLNAKISEGEDRKTKPESWIQSYYYQVNKLGLLSRKIVMMIRYIIVYSTKY